MCLCGQPHFNLPAGLVLSGTLEVLQAHLPGEVLFEGEGTPGLARTKFMLFSRKNYYLKDANGSWIHEVRIS